MENASRSLTLLSRAKKALAEAQSIDVLAEIRDQGHAALKYMKSRRDFGVDARNEASEIVLRAERRLGEMIASTFPHGGDRKSRCPDVTLNDAGITNKQSSRWQSEARVPEEVFEKWLFDTRASGKELTSGALVKLGKRSHRKDWAEERPDLSGVVGSLDLLIADGKKFRCIYADPPWGYSNQQTRASTDNHYPTMSVDQIAAEPVGQLADDDAHLHLWTTNAFLHDSFRIMEAWGFSYRSCFVWVKPQMGIGNYWRVSHEFMLLGVRGKATNFMANDETSWLMADRTVHSRKPRAIREKIMRVSPGPYLEMYGREAVPGWMVYGNQVEKDLLTQ